MQSVFRRASLLGRAFVCSALKFFETSSATWTASLPEDTALVVVAFIPKMPILPPAGRDRSDRPAFIMASFHGRTDKTFAQGIALLKRMHAMGLRHRAAHPGRVPYGSPGTFNEKETIRKARKFSDPVQGYSPAELKQLLEHCRRQRFALCWYHIVLLLGVADKASRLQLQTSAVDNSWSISELRAAIFKLRGNLRPTAGRRYNAADMGDHSLRLRQLCEQWDRSLAGYEKWAAAAAKEDKPAARFPPRVARQIAVVSRDLHRLRELLAPPSSKR